MVHSTVDAGAASTGLSRTASVPKHAMATNALKPKMETRLSLVLCELVVMVLPPSGLIDVEDSHGRRDMRVLAHEEGY